MIERQRIMGEAERARLAALKLVATRPLSRSQGKPFAKYIGRSLLAGASDPVDSAEIKVNPQVTNDTKYPWHFVDPRTVEGDPDYKQGVDDLWELHLLKSGGYGTGQDRFGNFTLVSAATGEPRHRYPRRRMLEKLARLESLEAQGRIGELEEEYLDIAGLAMCSLALLRKDKGAQ